MLPVETHCNFLCFRVISFLISDLFISLQLIVYWSLTSVSNMNHRNSYGNFASVVWTKRTVSLFMVVCSSMYTFMLFILLQIALCNFIPKFLTICAKHIPCYLKILLIKYLRILTSIWYLFVNSIFWISKWIYHPNLLDYLMFIICFIMMSKLTEVNPGKMYIST